MEVARMVWGRFGEKGRYMGSGRVLSPE